MYLNLTSRKALLSPFSRLRKKTGLTVREVSGKVGFSTRTVYRWEKGEVPPPPPVIEYLKRIAVESNRFSFIDLFAGIGGLRRGFESVGGNCVFTSEWDRHCRKVYVDNYRCDHEIAGDIREVKSSDIPKHDLLLAGFPCQPFSIAGVSKRNALKIPHGFRCDTQGTLFFEVARIIEHHRPKAFLLENVKNLASHDGGRTFNVILQTLTEELGYHVSWRIINARSYVPQHRERIFIAGFRKKNGNFSLDNLKIPNPDNGPRLESILHPEDGSESPTVGFIYGSRGKVLPKYTLTDHLWNYLQAYAEKHRRKGNGFGFGLVGPDDVARTLSARYFKDGSEILIRQKGKNPRRLTPRECARIMGFDKTGGRGGFRITVSDTQAYKQFGNAVVVPVVKAVARHMRPAIVDGTVQKTGRRSVGRHR